MSESRSTADEGWIPVAPRWRVNDIDSSNWCHPIASSKFMLGMLGESGSRKLTLATALLALVKPTSGSIERLMGEAQSSHRRVQMVFQKLTSSLNPRRTIGDIIGRPLIFADAPNRQGRISALLSIVAALTFTQLAIRAS